MYLLIIKYLLNCKFFATYASILFYKACHDTSGGVLKVYTSIAKNNIFFVNSFRYYMQKNK